MAEIYLTDYKIQYRKTKSGPYREYMICGQVAIKPYNDFNLACMKRKLPPEIYSCKDMLIQAIYRKLVGHTNT